MTLFTHSDIQLYLGDSTELVPQILGYAPTDYLLVLDPPYTLRTLQHVQDVLAHIRCQGSTNILAFTNPLPGYFLNGVYHEERDLAPNGIRRPTHVVKRLLQKTTGPVLDPFAGYGSTLRAAVELGRPGYGIERDPQRFTDAIKHILHGNVE
jgi:hypothetical protein